MKKKSVGVGVGTSSLMMIFTVLCLTVFSVLSLLQANRSYQESLKYQESIVQYYNADSEAMKVRALLINNQLSEEDKEKYQVKIANNITYNISINDYTYLEVVLDSNYEIITWKMVSDVDGDYGNQGFVF